MSDLRQRRAEMRHVKLIHSCAYAYNKAVYGANGYDIDADPKLVTERQWRAVLLMAEIFVASKGTLTAAQVRHQWAVAMSAQDTAHFLNHDLLTVFEDLPRAKQLEEVLGHAGMCQAMRDHEPIIIENHHMMDDDQLQWSVHSCDDQQAVMELARRRALRKLSDA